MAKKDNIRRIRTQRESPAYPDLGKLPPQALDLEEAVLGAIILEKNAFAEVSGLLQVETFYRDEHKVIFEACYELYKDDNPIDILTVANKLRKMGKLDFIGGAYYLSEISNRVGSGANIIHHARILVQKYLSRQLIEISTNIQSDAFEETMDVFELMDSTQEALFSLSEITEKRQILSINDAILDANEEIKSNLNKDFVGIPTGFVKLDRSVGPYQRGELIIIAARPGMGKTAFVLSLAKKFAMKFRFPVAFFSLEMQTRQLAYRYISQDTNIPTSRLQQAKLNQLDMQNLAIATAKLREAPIYIDDTPGLNIYELRAKARRLKAMHDIQIVIIDYLQLMSGRGEGKNDKMNREQEISLISRSLKGLAKELDIPVIALSQLSREVEKRPGWQKRPQLSDLRESGSIEQDADRVQFIFRPEYYDLKEDGDGKLLPPGHTEIITAKNRQGELRTVELTFKQTTTDFVDYIEFSDYEQTVSSAFKSITRGSRMNEDIEDGEVPF